MRKAYLIVSVLVLAVIANYLLGISNIDGDTGNPVCPAFYEDNSGGCGNEQWNCQTMGNMTCGKG